MSCANTSSRPACSCCGWSRSSPANTAKAPSTRSRPSARAVSARSSSAVTAPRRSPSSHPAVLAARMGLSAWAGTRLVADVLDLQHRLPAHWARVQALEVSEGHARHVARKTRHLTKDEAAYVDARIAPSADGRVSWSRFETLVEAAIVAADPDAAAEREEAAAREVFAKTTRSTENGMRGFYIRGDFGTIARIDATVAYLARALLAMGDTSTLDQRRVKAVLIMANPTQAVKILHAYAAWHRRTHHREQHREHPRETPPPTRRPCPPRSGSTPPPPPTCSMSRSCCPRCGSSPTSPTTAPWPGSKAPNPSPPSGSAATWVSGVGSRSTPVLDPLDQVPVDAYEIPHRHRQATHLLTPADVFPFAASTTRDMQIDHTIPWTDERAAAGEQQSRIGNYGPMTGFHHRIKTHGQWDSATTLPRRLPVARPLRNHLPRRPHRHPPPPPNLTAHELTTRSTLHRPRPRQLACSAQPTPRRRQ